MTTEAAFAIQVEHLLDLFGWTWIHHEPAIRQSGTWATPMRGMRGFPDYCAVRRGRVIFAEIKATNGRLTKHQKDWIELLQATETEVYVWYPENLPQVRRILQHD